MEGVRDIKHYEEDQSQVWEMRMWNGKWPFNSISVQSPLMCKEV